MSLDIVVQLKSWTLDWDGTPMSRDESPRDSIHCDVLFDAITEIERLRAALDKIEAMDPRGIRADDLGRAARIAHEAITTLVPPAATRDAQ